MRFLPALFLLLYTGCSNTGTSRHEHTVGPPAVKRRAEELKQIVVTPHLDFPLARGTNVLWCAAFQVAWNELSALAGGDIHMLEEDPAVTALNRKAVSRTDLDEKTYVAVAGIAGDGVLASAREALEQKFGGAASPNLLPAPGSLPEGWTVLYGYLFANLPFEWAFERHERPLRFGKADVECFGIQQYSEEQENEVKAAGQLQIYDCRDEHDFIVELKTQMAEHRLFLAMVPPRATLAETIRSIQHRVASARPEPMQEGRDFMVPVLNFDITRDYTELTGKTLDVRNRRLSGQQIASAKQQIRFRLDERGAVVKSESFILACRDTNLVFNRPFLIMLQYVDGRMPYFALWIENPELLTPFNRQPAGLERP